MLLMDDVINQLYHLKFFLTLNLQSGFWQIWMLTKNEEKFDANYKIRIVWLNSHTLWFIKHHKYLYSYHDWDISRLDARLLQGVCGCSKHAQMLLARECQAHEHKHMHITRCRRGRVLMPTFQEWEGYCTLISRCSWS